MRPILDLQISLMWEKGSPLQFLVDSESQKNLISVEVMKRLGLPTIAHPQLYTIGWIHKGRYIVSANSAPFCTSSVHSRMRYCVMFLLLMCLMYYWAKHTCGGDMLWSRPRVVIITLGNNLYRIPELIPPPVISLTTAKQRSKIVS